MSVAVLVSVHDGMVLAADSASTLMLQMAPGVAGVGKIYENANKVFNLIKGHRLGCMTWGTGSIGNASIATLIKDIRERLTEPTAATSLGFDPTNYTVEQVSGIVKRCFEEECRKLQNNPAALMNTNIGLLLAGYSSNERTGESWFVEIRNGVPQEPVVRIRRDAVGVTWGGQGEALQRLLSGFSPLIFQVLSEVGTQSPAGQATAQQLQNDLAPLFQARMQLPVAFPPMPIQDAIELGRWLVHTAIMASRFSPGPQVVGGPIEIATITKHEGYKWISRKHYYDKKLNREPSHVLVDKPAHVVVDQ